MRAGPDEPLGVGASAPAGGSAGTVDDAGERRKGAIAGAVAYALWGLFPLVFHQLRDVAALEVLGHRIVWSFVVVVAVLSIRRDRAWTRVLRSPGPARRRLVLAACFISVNWLVYVWAIAEGRVLEAALGYYINPLFTVALGVVVLRERLGRGQIVALALGAASVLVLTVAYGQVPWVSLVLAGSFGTYGYLKKGVDEAALTTLAVETTVLVPFAVVGLVVAEVRGGAAFLHGSTGRDLLLVALGAITAAPLLLFAASARRVPLVLLGLLQYVTPTMQFLIGVLVLGEDLPADRLAGFALVWAALVVLGLDAVRRSRPGLRAVDVEAAAGPG